MNTAVKRQPIPFGKYLLLDRINIGGMAEVWRGKTFGAGGFERLVAIKRILPNIAEDEEFISMFIDEAKITVQLNHANIAQIYELSHIASSYFIAMEYIPGKDMRAIFDRCRKKGEPAPIPLVCYVMGKSCEGLDYAHRKQVNGSDMNIVHRDVSPQNVLISYEGEVKVIDFGIAKAAGKATKTQAGILKGKFGYMSPEQIRGLPLDRRSDVFALGVCLYEMLTGERLFVGDSDFSVLEKVRKVEVLPPSTYNRKIPDALEKIVMKALAKDVDDRYQYASEVADDLQRFLITSDSIFSRKDLAQYMKSTFAEEVEREKQRINDYGDIKPPEGMLAAAEAGFGGSVPSVPAAPHAASPSAITNLPTMAPMQNTPLAGPGAFVVGGSNPRSAPGSSSSPRTTMMPPPTLTPSGPLPTLSPPAARSSNSSSMPRLTAVAPLLTNVEQENQSTMLVDGDTLFEPRTDSQTLAFVGNDATNERPNQVATDPQRPAVSRSTLQDTNPQVGIAGPVPDEPQLEKPTEAGEGLQALNETFIPVSAPRRAQTRQQTPMPNRRTGQDSRPERSSQPLPAPVLAPAPANNTRLIIFVGGAVAIVALIATVLLFMRPPPEGLLLVELPPEFAGKVMVNVNGNALSEKQCGALPKAGPNLCKVAAGKATVMIDAAGYRTLIEQVQIKEGTSDYSKLTQRLQKVP